MRLIIDTYILEKEDLTLKEFALLLYYKETGVILDTPIAEELWNKGYLCKEIDGYSIVPMKWNKLCHMATSIKIPDDKHLTNLATKLMELVPQGKIGDGPYYYKCNTKENVQMLRLFHREYRNNEGNPYSDKDIIDATKEYVDSFDGDYTRMVALRNYIYRVDRNTGDSSSLLASYLENKYDEENS